MPHIFQSEAQQIFSPEAHKVRRDVKKGKSKAKELNYQSFCNYKLVRTLIAQHGEKETAHFLASVDTEKSTGAFQCFMVAGVETAERINHND